MKAIILACILAMPCIAVQHELHDLVLSSDECKQVQKGLYRGVFASMMVDLQSKQYEQVWQKLKILMESSQIIDDEQDYEQMHVLLMHLLVKCIALSWDSNS